MWNVFFYAVELNEQTERQQYLIVVSLVLELRYGDVHI